MLKNRVFEDFFIFHCKDKGLLHKIPQPSLRLCRYQKCSVEATKNLWVTGIQYDFFQPMIRSVIFSTTKERFYTMD
ncbi:hypothetical protein EGY05_01415 [Chryseobacterium arthrosphaerae]|nr:hypothetical protein EGY05_01415 [Chryseobacterium arthrosphaerae]